MILKTKITATTIENNTKVDFSTTKSETKSKYIIAQEPVDFGPVVKDNYYFMTPIITKEDIVQLVENNRLSEAIKYINENTSKEIANYFYDLAKSYFYEKKYDEAELIYKRLIPLNTDETMKISDKSEFDLLLLYMNQGEYEKAYTFERHGRFLAHNNKESIFTLLIGLCEYHLARNLLLELNLSVEETNKLEKSFVDLYEERCKKTSYDSGALYKDINFAEFNKIEVATGLNINFLKKRTDLLNKYFDYLQAYQDNLKTSFIKKDNQDYKKLELKYLINLPINEVDYELIENKYINYLQNYFVEKAIHLKKNNSEIQTSVDQYNYLQINSLEKIELVLQAKELTSDQIFYALLKREVFLMGTLQSLALFNLINDKNIIHDNIFKLFLTRIPLFQCQTSYLDKIYQYSISRKINIFSYMTDYGIYKLGKQTEELIKEAQQLFAKTLKNKDQTKEEDYIFSVLGLLHIKYLLNPEDLTTINTQYINTTQKALQLIIKNKYSKDYIYNPTIGLTENLNGLINKINLLFDHDLRLVFLEAVINIIQKNSDAIKENLHLFKIENSTNNQF